MAVLTERLRNKLEKTVQGARRVAEEGARVALEALAVHQGRFFDHMTAEEKKLRNHLRARARQLGDVQDDRNRLDINHLIEECAYEHWHRMLFARYLAENGLLIEPQIGVALTLQECEELAREEGTDMWTLASRYAQEMLPQVFRPDDPLLQVMLTREHRLKLESLLDGLEATVFTARDSLGWVYQFWQSKKKQEINKSGRKIGADELPVVTQLFTESYMVEFLIHNTIGSWYAGKVLAEKPELASADTEEDMRRAVSLPGISWDYLRFVRDEDGQRWHPAAGVFAEWPSQAADLKVLDPCCGSGHFLVAALHHLVPLRKEEENLSPQEACDAVLRENLFGLEIDQRCTQIAAFALALAAWTYPNAGGYRQLPAFNIACSGIAPQAAKEKWRRLAGDDERLAVGMERLYEVFEDAPLLGSLINPREMVKGDLLGASFEELRPLLYKAMSIEREGYDQYEMGVTARGIADAVELLSHSYHVILTNVPYLACGKQEDNLRDFCEKNYGEAKNDLATVFLDRLLHLNTSGATTATVLPQNWLFLTSYTDFRERLLVTERWDVLAQLAEGGFDSSQAAGAFTVLLSVTHSSARDGHVLVGLDATEGRDVREKARMIQSGELKSVGQKEQLENPDARVVIGPVSRGDLLEEISHSYKGITAGDDPRYASPFWECYQFGEAWSPFQSTADGSKCYGGCHRVIQCRLLESPPDGAYIRGRETWGRKGVAVAQMRELPSALSLGVPFDTNTAVIVPNNPDHLPAIWCFCSSPEYNEAVRKIDQALKVTNATLVKVPFDLEYWQQVADEKYPDGLPKPYSDDPTQWIFHGYPAVSTHPLQVGVARLLGYRWPAELDDSMELSEEARDLVQHSSELDDYADTDGIVCISPLLGSPPADERLRALLAEAFEDNWSTTKERQLIEASGSKAKDLRDWMQRDFFEQHCKLFHQRPFVWHIWDGRKQDGFHALVNYHKLAEGGGKGRRLLEKLTYSYLGEWISRQRNAVRRDEDGADDRLVAAQELQTRLEAILEGEPPFDIFVRWKPLHQQAIGWEPDINDGVRLNIRPFMADDIPGGRKGSGVLRYKPSIRWSKDRGKEPECSKEEFPWFWENGEFTGDRVNDVHLMTAEKREARKHSKE